MKSLFITAVVLGAALAGIILYLMNEDPDTSSDRKYIGNNTPVTY